MQTFKHSTLIKYITYIQILTYCKKWRFLRSKQELEKIEPARMDHIVDTLIEKRVTPVSASENSEPLIALRTLQLAAPPGIETRCSSTKFLPDFCKIKRTKKLVKAD